MAEFVQIKRKGTDEIGTCSRAALPIWLAKGYELYEPPAPEVDAPTNEEPVDVKPPTDIEVAQRILEATKPGGDGELYDPTEHSVSEVLDYLADKDPVEIARVVEAERLAKRPRKGIVGEAGPGSTPIVPDTTTVTDTPPGEPGDEGNSTAGDDAEQNVEGAPAVQDPEDEQ